MLGQDTSSIGAVPAHPASFIGRERQLADLRRLLETSRLVTLTGPGGTGKTRLALRAAELYPFDRPTIFVPLAPLAQPDLVPLAIAEALGVAESTGRSTEEAILAALCQRASLLILDNLEHLLPPPTVGAPSRSVADLVSELLAGCPRIKVLVTSREALRITGEQVYAVPPLSLPTDSATTGEAVQLFVERARAASAFSLTPDTEADVAEICRRLDGLPLAIELAAARTAVLSPSALLRRLDQRLPILVGGARDLPTRQQTLRGAIAWSYDLLTPAEQALFRRAAVFHGGATLEAVSTVCLNPDRTLLPDTPALDDLALLELLQALAAKSVVLIEQDDEGEPRFTMFATIREFGLEQLDAVSPGAPSGETALIRGRHLAAFLELVRQRLDKRHSADARVWRGRLEREHDNLRSALQWCLVTRDAERGLALAGSLWSFWYSQRHFSEGRRWLAQILALADEVLPHGTPHAGSAPCWAPPGWPTSRAIPSPATTPPRRSLCTVLSATRRSWPPRCAGPPALSTTSRPARSLARPWRSMKPLATTEAAPPRLCCSVSKPASAATTKLPAPPTKKASPSITGSMGQTAHPTASPSPTWDTSLSASATPQTPPSSSRQACARTAPTPRSSPASPDAPSPSATRNALPASSVPFKPT